MMTFYHLVFLNSFFLLTLYIVHRMNIHFLPPRIWKIVISQLTYSFEILTSENTPEQGKYRLETMMLGVYKIKMKGGCTYNGQIDP